jgi:hypothetical protein
MAFKPDITLDDWVKADATVEERISAIRSLAEKSRYSGPYKELFSALAVDLYEVFEKIKVALKDGFQFRDLEEIFVAAAPALYNLYNTIGQWGGDQNRQAIFRDLVVFIYYELEKNLKLPGIAKFFLRLAVRMWGAKKISKCLLMAFDFVDGEIENLTGKAQKFIRDLI